MIGRPSSPAARGLLYNTRSNTDERGDHLLETDAPPDGVGSVASAPTRQDQGFPEFPGGKRTRYDLKNASRSALIVSACVVIIPCGNPL